MHVYANAGDTEDKPVMDVLITLFLFLSNVGLKILRSTFDPFTCTDFLFPKPINTSKPGFI